MNMLIKILKDPLLHFLLMGGVLFAVFQWGAGDGAAGISQIDEIVVTEGRVQTLYQTFGKVWQRAPTADELEGLIQDYIREEVLYREALAMGLDRDDTIVRRRMRQKIEFLSEDIASLEEPTEEELQEYLVAHPEKFRQDTRFSFRQVYLNADARGQSPDADALALLARLREQDGDAASAGDRIMIEHSFKNETEREIERALGRQFLQALRDTPQGSWQGPIVSGFGLHLVHISERIDGEVPELAEVRDIVLREWTAIKRTETNEAFYQMLRDRYKVTVEKPGSLSSSQLAMKETEK